MKQLTFLRSKNKLPVFVIHKHAATQLHYDFRLQIGSTMPSWAVPKGPTLDSSVKRLAMATTDHTLEYRTFEGTIPKGSYGGGTVMIWDEGIYIPELETSPGVREPIEDWEAGQRVMREGMQKGELKFFLDGKKLKGSFALVRMKRGGRNNAWLLLKHADAYVQAGYDAKDFDVSAKTGRNLKQIAAEG